MRMFAHDLFVKVGLAKRLHPLSPSPQDITERLHVHPFDIPDSFNCIFIGVPKTACTAMGASLFPHKKLVFHHPSIAAYRASMPSEFFCQLYKFAFVRDPFTRLLSAYNYLLSDKCEGHDHMFAHRLRKYSSFEHFVLEFLNPQTARSWMHFVPQWLFLSADQSSSASLLVDFVGKYENIEQDFSVVSNKLGIECKLKQMRVVAKTPTVLLQLSPEARDRIVHVYRRDFELFGYDTTPSV